MVSLSNHPGAVSDKPVAIKRLISSKHSRKFLIIGLLLLLAAVAAACFSDSLTAAPVSSQPATFTPFPAGTVQPVPKADSPTAAPVSPQPANVTPLPTATLTTKPKSTLPSSRPSGAGLADVAFDYVTELVEELGPRESATEEELEAVERLASTLENLGYAVELQSFTVKQLSRELSSLEIDLPQPRAIDINPLAQTATGEGFGNLVSVGLARDGDFPEGGVEGQIAWVRRGVITFEEKVALAA